MYSASAETVESAKATAEETLRPAYIAECIQADGRRLTGVGDREPVCEVCDFGTPLRPQKHCGTSDVWERRGRAEHIIVSVCSPNRKV